MRGSVLISSRSHEPGYPLENKKVQVGNITLLRDPEKLYPLSRLKWGGEAEPVIVTRTKNEIVKDPTTIKFSTSEELNLPQKLVKR